jgi:PcfJ-like protein
LTATALGRGMKRDNWTSRTCHVEAPNQGFYDVFIEKATFNVAVAESEFTAAPGADRLPALAAEIDGGKIVRPRREEMARLGDVDPTTIRASLLADEHGVFGVGLTSGDRLVGLRARAEPAAVFLRGGVPSQCNDCALQPIPQGRTWRHTAEFELADQLLTAMLARGGIERENRDFYPGDWWSREPTAQASNRRRFHAYRRSAYAIVNNLVREALAAAPAEPLRVARRFPPKIRYGVYRAIAASPRMLQLANIFPALVADISETHTRGSSRPKSERLAEQSEARQLVERGARLNVVAEFAKVPLALRKCRPGATDLALGLNALVRGEDLDLSQLIHAHIPSTTQGQRRWFRAINEALRRGGPYVEWVARHALELGTTRGQTEAAVSDIGDFVRAGYIAQTPRHVIRAMGVRVDAEGAKFVTRPFSPEMTADTVRNLSAAWHEAVALDKSDSREPLPAPWRDAETVGGLTIAPLATAAEIAAEGRAMHHCARTLIPKVAAGNAYLFSVRQGDKRVATIEVERTRDGRVAITQMRGLCNAILDKTLQTALRKWAGQQAKWRPKSEVPPPERAPVAGPWRAARAVAPWCRPAPAAEIAA